ncbi:PAS domain-containing protein [Paenibacillus agricola]|uniref:PAS domain S-box protein n=1 Tax=Paenibacillus agricola TaxID=2716264 RepID=A0ABX0J2I7_9BACL|nr:PAS domain-containing protein [Paenibacillus agricola]NHN30562.1 PAS domain S-box protein [Paenibacillus agricola]
MNSLNNQFAKAAEGMYYTYEEKGKSRFIEVNDAFSTLVGISKSKLLSMDPNEIFAPESLKKMEQKKQRLNQKGYLYAEETLNVNNGDKLSVEIHSSKIRWEQKDLYFHVVKEVSEKKWLSSQIRNKPLMASGLLNEELVISEIHNHYEPLPFEEPKEGFIGSSLLSFINSAESLKVRRSISKALEYHQEKQVTFMSINPYDTGDIKLRAVFKPLFNGNNEVIKIAFILCRADSAEEVTEPPISPLLLACL